MSYAQYDPAFRVDPDELAEHIRIVERIGEIVTELCRRRIGLYENR